MWPPGSSEPEGPGVTSASFFHLLKIITKPFNLNVSAQFHLNTSNKNSAELYFTLFGLRSFNSRVRKVHVTTWQPLVAWHGLALNGFHWLAGTGY